ncbi:unnamed protein product [Allacma fusca]|uniref:Uncharacterized protein n=1 Tax=Allacma fusca TaxID=39272 RepID=A0A8J2M944_9HEXA|nr:unnamed protein product [Allacma fusca]
MMFYTNKIIQLGKEIQCPSSSQNSGGLPCCIVVYQENYSVKYSLHGVSVVVCHQESNKLLVRTTLGEILEGFSRESNSYSSMKRWRV